MKSNIQLHLEEILDNSENYFSVLTVNVNSVGIQLAAPEKIEIDELHTNTLNFLLLWFSKLNTICSDIQNHILNNGIDDGYKKFISEDFTYLHDYFLNKDDEDELHHQLTEKMSIIAASTSSLYNVKKYSLIYKFFSNFSFFRKKFNKEVLMISNFMYSYFWIIFYFKIALNKKEIEIENFYKDYKKLLEVLHE